MKKTKVKILETALKLFNAQGLSKVTLRTIAKEMGISQGNLNYHYKKRDDIIEALYFQLVEKMNDAIGAQNTLNTPLEILLQSSKGIMENLYVYRFFFLDFTQIMRENKKISEHYAELSKIRENQFLQLFNALIATGIFRVEKQKNEYYYLYKRLQILVDFWMSSVTIIDKKINVATIAEYQEIIGQSIYPYFTSKGEAAYLKSIEE